jgi:hypothetical protein
MITELQPTSLRSVTQRPLSTDSELAGIGVAGRLIHVTLALYLLPAFLVVMVIGGIGTLVLAIGSCLTGSTRRTMM